MEAADVMSAPVVRVRDLRLMRGARTILDGVSLEVSRGEIVALKGASGSGKTTMLRTIAGLEPFDAGSVDVEGVALAHGPLASSTLKALRSKVGMVFQFHCLFEHLSALENVTLAPVHVQGMAAAAAVVRARELLGLLGVEHRANAYPRELSGGEAQRVAIARALATDPPLLLMDEPTASLDPERRAELTTILRRLVSRGRTLMIATHDEDFAASTATRIVRVHDGRLEPVVSDQRGR
jgi:ABC-type polar amino acid transport system ATPase subunit